uniref:RAP domain-containing protein n=1 Tax=Neospora caninum (strain Liverpool) TaxID=572307 RepID=A0A0F7UH17_NEOCL|nr:TPA: RAP domain-containing protein [Neospora caninum Liverpool]
MSVAACLCLISFVYLLQECSVLVLTDASAPARGNRCSFSRLPPDEGSLHAVPASPLPAYSSRTLPYFPRRHSAWGGFDGPANEPHADGATRYRGQRQKGSNDGSVTFMPAPVNGQTRGTMHHGRLQPTVRAQSAARFFPVLHSLATHGTPTQAYDARASFLFPRPCIRGLVDSPYNSVERAVLRASYNCSTPRRHTLYGRGLRFSLVGKTVGPACDRRHSSRIWETAFGLRQSDSFAVGFQRVGNASVEPKDLRHATWTDVAFPWGRALLHRHAKGTANAATHGPNRSETPVRGAPSRGVGALPASGAPHQTESPHTPSADTANDSEYVTTSQPTTEVPIREPSQPPSSLDFAWRSANDAPLKDSEADAPVRDLSLSDPSSVNLQAPERRQPGPVDGRQTLLPARAVDKRRGQNRLPSARGNDSRGLWSPDAHPYHKENHRASPASTTRPPRERNEFGLSKTMPLGDAIDHRSSVPRDLAAAPTVTDVSGPEEMMQDGASRQQAERSTRNAASEMVRIERPTFLRAHRNLEPVDKGHPSHETRESAEAEGGAGVSANDRVTGGRGMNWNAPWAGRFSSERHYRWVGEREVKHSRRGTYGQQGSDRINDSSDTLRSPRGFRSRDNTTGDSDGSWTVRRLYDIRNLEDLWNLLQKHNLHRLSGLELANIILRLSSLSSVAPNARSKNDAGVEVPGEPDDVYHPFPCEGRDDNTDTEWRKSQRKVPYIARIIRMREEVKRHPIFKDILSLLPQRVGSLDVSSAVALLHALARFGLRPSATLLARLADVIVDRALVGFLDPHQEVDEKARAPGFSMTRREHLKDVELSQLWVACETIAPLQRERLFPALMQLTMRKFRTAASRLENALGKEDASKLKPFESRTSHDDKIQRSDQLREADQADEGKATGREGNTRDVPGSAEHNRRSQAGQEGTWRRLPELGVDVETIAAVARAAAGMHLGEFHERFVQVLERLVTALLRQGCHIIGLSVRPQETSESGKSDPKSSGCAAHDPRGETSRSRRGDVGSHFCNIRGGGCRQSLADSQFAATLARLVYSLTKLKQRGEKRYPLAGLEVCAGGEGSNRKMVLGKVPRTQWTGANEAVVDTTARHRDGSAAASTVDETNPLSVLKSQLHSGNDSQEIESRHETDRERLLESFAAFFALAADRVLPVHSQLPQLLAAASFLFRDHIKKLRKELPSETEIQTTRSQTRCRWMDHETQQVRTSRASSHDDAGTVRRDDRETHAKEMVEGTSKRGQFAKNMFRFLSVATQALDREWARLDSLPNVVTLLLSLNSLEQSRICLEALNEDSRQVELAATENEAERNCTEYGSRPERKQDAPSGLGHLKRPQRCCGVDSVLQRLGARLHLLLDKLSTSNKHPSGASSLQVKHLHLLENSGTLLRLLFRLNRHDTAALLVNRIEAIIGSESESLQKSLTSSTEKGLSDRFTESESRQIIEGVHVARSRESKSEYIFEDGWITHFDTNVTRKVRELNLSRDFRRRIQSADSVEEVLQAIDAAAAESDSITGTQVQMESGSGTTSESPSTKASDSHFTESDALCLDSLSLSSALHRLAVLQERCLGDRGRNDGRAPSPPGLICEKETLTTVNSQAVVGPRKGHEDRWLHDGRMRRLLGTIFVKIPSMDHQLTRILWALEKLGLFERLSAASSLRRLSSIELAGHVAAGDSSRGMQAGLRASSVEKVCESSSDYTLSSTCDDTANPSVTTDGSATRAFSFWEHLLLRLFSRLSELATARELDGTQLSSALRVLASIKAQGFFDHPYQAIADPRGAAAPATAQDLATPQAEQMDRKLRNGASSLLSVAVAFRKRMVECEARLNGGFRHLLLHLAPSLSALDASTSLFSLATLDWDSATSSVAQPVKADESPGALQRGISPSADEAPVVAAVLRRLRMEISNCNAQALTNAIWAVATIASKRQKEFDRRQLKNNNAFHAREDNPLRFEDDEERSGNISLPSETEDFALYLAPVALDREEKLFLETVRRYINSQVHLLGREALSMLLLAALILRWQEPQLLLSAVRRALALLRRAQRRRCMRHNRIPHGDGHQQHKAEEPVPGQASSAAPPGSCSSTGSSASSEGFPTPDGLRFCGEEDRGEGELHSRVWAVLAMLQQQSLDKFASPREFPSAGLTGRTDTVERATELSRGRHVREGTECSKRVPTSPNSWDASQALNGDAKSDAKHQACDFLDAETEAAEVLKADLEQMLCRSCWPPPKHKWRTKHVQSILLSLMTLQQDREKHSQEKRFLMEPSSPCWTIKEQQQCLKVGPSSCEREASSNVTTKRGLSANRERVPPGDEQRQQQSSAGREELLCMLEAFVARSIRAVTCELTSIHTAEEKKAGFSAEEKGIVSEAGEIEASSRQRQIVNHWIKRVSLLFFALRRLRRTMPETDSLAAWFVRDRQQMSRPQKVEKSTCYILERHLTVPDQLAGGTADAVRGRNEAEKRSQQWRPPWDSLSYSRAPDSHEPRSTRTYSDALEAMIELIAVMLRSRFASPSHGQFPSLLLELHSFLSAWHQKLLPSQVNLTGGSATTDVVLDRAADAEDKNAGDAPGTFWSHTQDRADQRAACSTETHTPIRHEDDGGSHAYPRIANDGQNGGNESFGFERINAVLQYHLRPALISWLVENMHTISDPMYNRLFPLLQLLGAKEEVLTALNAVALQSSPSDTAHDDGKPSQENASAFRLNTSVPEETHLDDPSARMPIHEGSAVLPALRRSRAALLSLLLHHRERLTFQPPSLFTSLLKAAFPRRVLPHFLPTDLAHGLTALQRLKASAEAPDDVAVAAFLATAYEAGAHSGALNDSCAPEPVSNSPVATCGSCGEVAADSNSPGDGESAGSPVVERRPQSSTELPRAKHWARRIVEDVPLELIALLNRPIEACRLTEARGGTGIITGPCSQNRDGSFLPPKTSSPPTGAGESTTRRLDRQLHQSDSGTGRNRGDMLLGVLEASPQLTASATGDGNKTLDSKTVSQGTMHRRRTYWDLLEPQQLSHAGAAAAQLLGVPSAAPTWLRMLERLQPEITVGCARAQGGPEAGGASGSGCIGWQPVAAATRPEFHSANRRNETAHSHFPDSSVATLLSPAAAALTGYLLSLESPIGNTSLAAPVASGDLGVLEAGTKSASLSGQGTGQFCPLRSTPAGALLPEPPIQRQDCSRRVEAEAAPQQWHTDALKSWSWRRVRALVREKGDRLSAAGALRLLGGGPKSLAVGRSLAKDAMVLANVLHLLQGSQHRMDEYVTNVKCWRQHQAKADNGDNAKFMETSTQTDVTGMTPEVPAQLCLNANRTADVNDGLRLLVSEERPEVTGHTGKHLPTNDDDAAPFIHVSRSATSPVTADAPPADDTRGDVKEEEYHAERLLPLQQLCISYFLELLERLALLDGQRTTSQRPMSLTLEPSSGKGKSAQLPLSSHTASNGTEDRDIAATQHHTKDDAVDIRQSLARLLMTLATAPSLPLDSAASLAGPVISLLQKLQRGHPASDAGQQRRDETKEQGGHAPPAVSVQLKRYPAETAAALQDGNDLSQENSSACSNRIRSAVSARECGDQSANIQVMLSGTGRLHDSPATADQLSRDLRFAAWYFLQRMLPLVQEWFPRLHGHRGAALLRLLWESNGSDVLAGQESTAELASTRQLRDQFRRRVGGELRSRASCLMGRGCTTADSADGQSERGSEPVSGPTVNLMSKGTSQEVVPGEQKQPKEEDHEELGEGAQAHWTGNERATMKQFPFSGKALVCSLQSAVLRSLGNLSPGALARLWEALSLQEDASATADHHASSLDSQPRRQGHSLGIPAVGSIVANKLMALARTAAYGELPRGATSGTTRPAAYGTSHAGSPHGSCMPLGRGDYGRSQGSAASTVSTADHEQWSVETGTAGAGEATPEERDTPGDDATHERPDTCAAVDHEGFSAPRESHWIAGAVAAAGSGLLGSDEQQRIATAAARDTHGSSAYFALLSFFANSKNVPVTAAASLVRKLLVNARRLISGEGSLNERPLFQAEPNKTRPRDPEALTEEPAERGEASVTPGHEFDVQRTNEGGKLTCIEAGPPTEDSRTGANESRLNCGVQEESSPGRLGSCRESVKLRANCSSTDDVDSETVVSEESRKRKQDSREADLMTAGWLLWIAANIHQRSGEHSLHRRQQPGWAEGHNGENGKPQGPIQPETPRDDEQRTPDLNDALQFLLNAVLAELAEHRLQVSSEQNRSWLGNGSSKLVAMHANPGEIYVQLILCLDILARIRHPFKQPESSDGFRSGELPRHPALSDLLDGLTHLINECTSDIEADIATTTSTDAVRQSTAGQYGTSVHFLHNVKRPRRYCSLDSLAYVLHLSRQARVFHPPLVDAVSRAVRSHRRLRLGQGNTAPFHQSTGVSPCGGGMVEAHPSANMTPQQTSESLRTASCQHTSKLLSGGPSSPVPNRPSRKLQRDGGWRSQKERHWPAVLLLADAAIHQPQESLAVLRRELLLMLDDDHAMEALPLQHLIRVLRFALTSRDPVRYRDCENTSPAILGRQEFGCGSAASSVCGRDTKEHTRTNPPTSSSQDGISHGELSAEGEEKGDADLKRHAPILSCDQSCLSALETRPAEQRPPKSEIAAVPTTDSKSLDSLIAAKSNAILDTEETASARLGRHPDGDRSETVYATIAARCVREGALLLNEMRRKKEQGRGAFLHFLMDLEKKGYAPVGLIDTLNKVRLLHLMSGKSVSRTALNHGSSPASCPELSFAVMTPSSDRIVHGNRQDKAPITKPHYASHQWMESPLAAFGLYERAGSSEAERRHKPSSSRSVRGKAEISRILVDQGREWPGLLRAAVRHYISKGSSGLHKAISATLTHELGVAHENEAWTSGGLSLDITLAAQAADGQRVAVEVDGPTHFVEVLRGVTLPGSGTRYLDGPQFLPTALTQFKHQILRSAGWHVLSVPFFEWHAPQTPEAPAGRPHRQCRMLRRKLAAYLPSFAESEQIADTSPHGSLPLYRERQSQCGSNSTDKQGSDGSIDAVELSLSTLSTRCLGGSPHLSAKDNHQQQLVSEATVTRETPGTVSGLPAGLFSASGSKQVQLSIARVRDTNKNHDGKNPDTYQTIRAGRRKRAAASSGRGGNKSIRTRGKDTSREAQPANNTSADFLPQQLHGKGCQPAPSQKGLVADENPARQKASKKRMLSGASLQSAQGQGAETRSRGRRKTSYTNCMAGSAGALHPQDDVPTVGHRTTTDSRSGYGEGGGDARTLGPDCGGTGGWQRKRSKKQGAVEDKEPREEGESPT